MLNFLPLPNDIISHIVFFVKSACVNSIIVSWRRYIFHKKFIITYIYSLPKFYSFIDDNDLIYSVISEHTYFFIKKLYYITTGNEIFFTNIYYIFYRLAVSIDDYEWVSGADNFYYSFNKYHCISIALKFKWNDILHLLQ